MSEGTTEYEYDEEGVWRDGHSTREPRYRPHQLGTDEDDGSVA